MGIDAMIEAVDLIKAGNPPAIVQDESKATYEAPCRDEHAKIDFSKPARTVFNLIRGCDPQPGAYASLGEKRLRLYDVSFSPAADAAAPGKPAELGRIVAIDSGGMKIALSGGSIIAKRARIDPNPKKVAPAELATAGEVTVGAHLT
jgi:methionyl-tRNA formyltransferase